MEWDRDCVELKASVIEPPGGRRKSRADVVSVERTRRNFRPAKYRRL